MPKQLVSSFVRYFDCLTIKLSHFLTELELANDLFELWLIHQGSEPSVGVLEGLSKFRIKHLKQENILGSLGPFCIVSLRIGICLLCWSIFPATELDL